MKQLIEKIIEKRNLTISFEAVAPFIKSTIGITKSKLDENLIPLGASKMGGLPDLPIDWEFPIYEHMDQPLTFLCQINCEEAKPFDKNNELPDTGILYFFMDTVNLPTFSIEEEGVFGSWKVLYFDGDIDQLKRTPFPFSSNSDYNPFPSCRIDYKSIYTMLDPAENKEMYGDLLNNEEAEDDFIELSHIINKELHHDMDELLQSDDADSNDWLPYHQLLGYHQNIQADSLIYVLGDYFFVNEFDLPTVKEEKERWSLLFQFDADDELEWHLDGKIYFFIPKDDLKEKNFDETYVTWLC